MNAVCGGAYEHNEYYSENFGWIRAFIIVMYTKRPLNLQVIKKRKKQITLGEQGEQ